jgi:hypothetical protein
MTVHCLKIRAESPDSVGLQEVRDAVERYIDTHEEVLEAERVGITDVVQGEQQPAPTHLHGTFRFTLDSTKRELIGQAEDVLQQVVNWYVLGYHGCDHDLEGSDRGDCSWDAVVTWGPVPSEVSL